MPLAPRYQRRIARLQELLPQSGIERLWIEPSANFLYLTGLELLSIERLTGLVVSSDGLALVVPKMLAEECEDLDAVLYEWTDDAGPSSAIKAVVEGPLHIQATLPASSWKTLRDGAGVDVDLGAPLVESLRERKDRDELGALRRAGEEADAMIQWLSEQDLNGLTESQIGKRIRIRFMESDLEPVDHPLVASGPNAAMPHYAGGDVVVDPLSPLLLDLGCRVDGYWSDITRVLFPRDLPDETRKLYDVVCAAYDAALAVAAPGVPCQEVDRAARRVIGEAGLGDAFVHRTGHGVGLDIHEGPYIREGEIRPLELGNVFSIEPGIYLSGTVGLRFENIVALGDEGPEVLNAAPRVNYLGISA